MKKTFLLTLLATVLTCIATVSHAQSEKVMKIINERGFWRPSTQWLENERAAMGYLSDIHSFSKESMRGTLEAIRDDSLVAREILDTERAIVGKKKGKKREQRLSEHFKDVERANSVFATASETLRLQEMLSSAINTELSHRPSPQMPSGQLSHFSFSNSNGFAGFRLEVTLDKKSGAGTLLVKEENRNRFPPDQEKDEATSQPVEVNDSVFTRVRTMVEEGLLYDIGSSYYPDYMIMDASGWSLYMKFDGGSISSGGYATGPDHSDTLHKIIKYLSAVYDALKP